MNKYYIIIGFINLIVSLRCELFSAIAGLEQMLQIEENILKNIDTFLSETENKYNYLNR